MDVIVGSDNEPRVGAVPAGETTPSFEVFSGPLIVIASGGLIAMTIGHAALAADAVDEAMARATSDGRRWP